MTLFFQIRSGLSVVDGDNQCSCGHQFEFLTRAAALTTTTSNFLVVSADEIPLRRRRRARDRPSPPITSDQVNNSVKTGDCRPGVGDGPRRRWLGAGPADGDRWSRPTRQTLERGEIGGEAHLTAIGEAEVNAGQGEIIIR